MSTPSDEADVTRRLTEEAPEAARENPPAAADEHAGDPTSSPPEA